jgi:hypothetical protein
MLSVPAMLTAQSETTTFKNEFGTDVIGLVQQILNLNQGQFNPPYAPIYHLTYKRHFDKFSARVGIGGNISADNVDNNAINETIKNSRVLLNYRIGVEKSINLSKRWNFGFPSNVRKFLPVYPDFLSGQISLISADFVDFK